MVEFCPKFKPIIVDLPRKELEDIHGRVEYKIVMITMKYSHIHTEGYYKDVDIVLKNNGVDIGTIMGSTSLKKEDIDKL